MSKIRQNTIIYFLVAALVFTGNFAYALTHLDCVVEETTHHTCQEDCCATSDCCEEENNSGFEQSVTISNEQCCEVHIDQARPQDAAVLTFAKSTDNIKTGFVKSEVSIHTESTQAFPELPQYNTTSQNIYLTVSNLRI